MQEVQIGGWSRQRGHKLQEPISKIIKAKMTGGMAQMVELLPTKHARPKIKKKKKEGRTQAVLGLEPETRAC
jgi:hypothetical protein